MHRSGQILRGGSAVLRMQPLELRQLTEASSACLFHGRVLERLTKATATLFCLMVAGRACSGGASHTARNAAQLSTGAGAGSAPSLAAESSSTGTCSRAACNNIVCVPQIQ